MEIVYFCIPLIAAAIAFIEIKLSNRGAPWLATLKNPPWVADPIAEIVWCVLFITSILSALLAWDMFQGSAWLWLLVALFSLYSFLNVSWNYLFYVRHNLRQSFWNMVIIDINTLFLIGLVVQESRVAALLLVPYLLWVMGVTKYNYSLWKLNSI